MKTIQTKPDCILGFIKAPNGYTNPSMIIPKGSRFGIKEIGKLSDITEEQAKELVQRIQLYGYKHYNDKTQEVAYLKATDSLYSTAEKLGIEEKDFDKYLVIKL